MIHKGFWWSPIYLFFPFVAYALSVISKKHRQIQGHKHLALIFWVFDPFWATFCMWLQVRVNLILLSVEIQLLQTHMLNRLSSPYEWSGYPSQKSADHRRMTLNYITVTYMCILMPVPHYFHYCGFYINSWNKLV